MNFTQTTMTSRHRAFTIVELLIVIVVIGILAAISIVAYNGIQNRARTSAVHTDLVNVKKKLALYQADQGRLPQLASELTSADLSIGSTSNYEKRTSYANFYYCLDINNDKFAIGARVADGQPSSYYITSDRGVTSHASMIDSGRTCQVLGLGGTGAAHGAYSASGLNTNNSPASWLKAGN